MTSCFAYINIRDLLSIDHLCINPIRRIGLILKGSIDSWKLKWNVQVNVLLNNCKQNTISLSLLPGRAVSLFYINKFSKAIFIHTFYIPIYSNILHPYLFTHFTSLFIHKFDNPPYSHILHDPFFALKRKQQYIQ